MSKVILIVSAHPESTSLTCSFMNETIKALQHQGHTVLQSNLYRMRWKAVFDDDDFPARIDTKRLNFIKESQHAFSTNHQTDDVANEQKKLLAADAVIFHFPLWWFGMPAILKGWIDRVYAYGFAYGYKGEGNRYRYGDGVFKNKRALLSVMVGGPEQDYLPRGINGSLDELLFPITHGALFFPGFDVLATHAVYDTGRLGSEEANQQLTAWSCRLQHLFDESPIAFRHQNSSDYQDNNLAADILPNQSGLSIHIKNE